MKDFKGSFRIWVLLYQDETFRDLLANFQSLKPNLTQCVKKDECQNFLVDIGRGGFICFVLAGTVDFWDLECFL